MGTVKTKDDKVVFENIDKEIEEAEKSLPTPDTTPVDGDELIKATKPKKVKKTEEKPKKVKPTKTSIEKDLDKLGDWVANQDALIKVLDAKVEDMNKLLTRVATRMGL